MNDQRRRQMLERRGELLRQHIAYARETASEYARDMGVFERELERAEAELQAIEQQPRE